MSLRKSTCLTPRRRDAARRNSQHSTGPRSEAGKQRMKMNALKHGCDAAAENEAAVMRALGEDPEQFAALKRDLMTTYGPGDALWDQQLEDLAKLYWRRNRIERMETGLMRRALHEVEERQRLRREQLAAFTFGAANSEAVGHVEGEPLDRCVQLRLRLSQLQAIRERVGRGFFAWGQHLALIKHPQGTVGWRSARLRFLLSTLGEWAQSDDAKQGTGGEEAAAMEAAHQELLRVLEEEIGVVEKALGEEMKAQEEKDAIERDACLAPEGKTWEMLLRQEMALDRSIDRKVKILLTMRKEHGGERGLPARTCTGDCGLEARAPGDESNEGEEQERGAAGGRPVRAGTSPAPAASADAGLKASATRSDSPAEKNAAETSKSPEQSENVIENKGPAAEEVRG